MGKKQTREWLMRAWNVDREIETLKEAHLNIYAQWINTAERLGKLDPGIKKGLSSGAVFEAFTKLGEELSKSYLTLWNIKRETIRAIEKVSDSTMRTLLLQRFINYKTWEQVAEYMNYSYSNVVHNMYPDAVNMMTEVLRFSESESK